MTVTELRQALEKLEKADKGYESWQVQIIPKDLEREDILDDVDYQISGVESPENGDHDLGWIFLHVELSGIGITRSRPIA